MQRKIEVTLLVSLAVLTAAGLIALVMREASPLHDLAGRLGCQLHGNPDLEITGVAGLEQAGPTHLTFLANPKYAPKVKNTRSRSR